MKRSVPLVKKSAPIVRKSALELRIRLGLARHSHARKTPPPNGAADAVADEVADKLFEAVALKVALNFFN